MDKRIVRCTVFRKRYSSSLVFGLCTWLSFGGFGEIFSELWPFYEKKSTTLMDKHMVRCTVFRKRYF